MMTVREVARQSGVSAGAIRYYSRIGLIRPKRNSRNQYRQYQHADVAGLRFIRRAKSLGYTLKEIATIMQEARKGKSPCPIVRTIIGGRIVQNRVALSEMLGLQMRMEKALKKWARMPDRLPDGESICYLIETTGEL